MDKLDEGMSWENAVKEGDKVIRKDGLVGKVRCKSRLGIVDAWLVDYETGANGYICPALYDNFYLIGKTVLGNKIDEEKLQRQLDEQKIRVQEEQNRYDQLRKQMWYLKNRMVDDWQERKAEAEKNKQEKAERNAEKPPEQAQKGEKDNRLTNYKG